MKKKRIAIVVVAVVVVTVVATIYSVTGAGTWRRTMVQLELAEPAAGDLMASGFIEAEEIDIAPELGGRVAEVLVKEGDDVEAGQLLVQLDGTLLQAQVESAEAALDVAQAELDQALAGVRPEQIRRGEAALAQAEAGRDGTYQAWQDAIAIRENPQELNAQIVDARGRVAEAEAALARATALKDAAEIAHDAYWDGREKMAKAKEKLKEIPPSLRPSVPGMQLDFHLIPNRYWKAWVGVNAAQAGLDGAQVALRDLYALRSNPQELNARVDELEAEYRSAEASVQAARARLEALRSGATGEEIAVAQAQVGQAQAALDSLIVQRDKQTIFAPVGGLVLELTIRQGELAAPGATMLKLGDLDHVTLTVYVPEDRLGHVSVGQPVEVSVDSFPDRTFMGRVVAIADEAEFTPRNVQTQEERVNMVFAVDVHIPNPDHVLKPGVPADALIITHDDS
jgi:multidrug resistance efflux pump